MHFKINHKGHPILKPFKFSNFNNTFTRNLFSILMINVPIENPHSNLSLIKHNSPTYCYPDLKSIFNDVHFQVLATVHGIPTTILVYYHPKNPFQKNIDTYKIAIFSISSA